MKVQIGLHSEKESMMQLGEQLGMSEEALNQFKYACYEVLIDLEVDVHTGLSEIIAVDGKPLAPDVND